MLLTTTGTVQGKDVTYLGIVSGEAIMGTNVVRDMFAYFTDIFGGRSGTYERAIRDGKAIAMKEMQEKAMAMGANAIIGIDIDYETVQRGMLMVITTGTAVKLL